MMKHLQETKEKNQQSQFGSKKADPSFSGIIENMCKSEPVLPKNTFTHIFFEKNLQR